MSEERIASALERIATALEQAALERMPAAPARLPVGGAGQGLSGDHWVGPFGPTTPEPPPYVDVSPEFRQSRDLPPAPFLPIGWTCPVHHGVKTVPAGVSRKSGKPYDAFLACPEPGCDQKPPRR